MSDAALALQKAIIDALKAHAGVAAIVAGRVYDPVPTSAVKPYISLGPVQVFPEQADEYDGSDTYVTIDAWSAGPGAVEIKQMGAAIRAALDEQVFSLEGNQRLVGFDIEQTNYLTEPDGITRHASLTFRARTEPSA